MANKFKSEIAPKGLEFRAGDIVIGDKYCCLMTVVSYPKSIYSGYLSNITQLGGVKLLIKQEGVFFGTPSYIMKGNYYERQYTLQHGLVWQDPVNIYTGNRSNSAACLGFWRNIMPGGKNMGKSAVPFCADSDGNCFYSVFNGYAGLEFVYSFC